MKSLFLFVTLLGVVALGSSSLSGSKAADASKRQKATTHFNQPVRLQGVILKGEYLFVHDDAAMASGEACTFVYKGNSPVKENLVVSFHCIPAQRLKVKSFTVRTQQIAGVDELREFQFEGDLEAHMVPGTK